MKLNKKGVMKAGILVLLVVMLLFFVANGILSLALTPEEEKQQLEAELAEIEGRLAVISAGLGQDFGGLVCGVDKIKQNNYNSECLMVVKSECGSMSDEVVKIKLRIEEIKSQLKEMDVLE